MLNCLNWARVSAQKFPKETSLEIIQRENILTVIEKNSFNIRLAKKNASCLNGRYSNTRSNNGNTFKVHTQER